MAEVSDEIMQAKPAAKAVFGLELDTEYFPHLSLMYGDLQAATKKQIVRKLGGNLNLRSSATSFYSVLSIDQC